MSDDAPAPPAESSTAAEPDGEPIATEAEVVSEPEAQGDAEPELQPQPQPEPPQHPEEVVDTAETAPDLVQDFAREVSGPRQRRQVVMLRQTNDQLKKIFSTQKGYSTFLFL